MAAHHDQAVKEFEALLKEACGHAQSEIRMIRGNRPSVELLENIRVNYYDQQLTVKQLSSLSVKPPREIELHVWDKNAVAPVMKAIEDAKVGMTATNDGTLVRAFLPVLTDERRQELGKLVRKTAEAAKIQVRNHRDEMNKKLKAIEEKGEIGEDQFFTMKEAIQKIVDDSNGKIDAAVRDKIKEIEE